jgi:hypothetical protein
MASAGVVNFWTPIRPQAGQLFHADLHHGRYVTFQLAEVAVPRTLFAEILGLIEQLRPEPAPT